MVTNLRTWAGNLTYAARELLEPQSLDDLRHAVAGSARLRALGTRHSFSAVADTTGDLVSVARLPRRLEIDAGARTATVSAGLRYGEVVPELDAAGLALANLGSLPHISVGGATATGTHGSGETNQVLASSVAAIELVTASGDVVRINREDERFAGSVIALGRLGVVTALTLDLVPAFEVRQEVHLGLPAAAALEHLDALVGGAYSVSLFTQWVEPWEFQVLSKHRTPTAGGPDRAAAAALAEELGARPAEGPWHMVPGMPPENCTEQLGVPGRWHARLPHFKLEFTPSSGDELQSEYFVARSDGAGRARRRRGSAGRHGARAAGQRDPYDRPRRALAQPRERAGDARAPLHLGRGHGGGAAGGPGGRAGAGAVRGSSALGQGVHHAGCVRPGAVPAIGRGERAGAGVRPGR